MKSDEVEKIAESAKRDNERYAKCAFQNLSYQRQIHEQTLEIRTLKRQLKMYKSENKGLAQTVRKLTSNSL